MIMSTVPALFAVAGRQSFTNFCYIYLRLGLSEPQVVGPHFQDSLWREPHQVPPIAIAIATVATIATTIVITAFEAGHGAPEDR
eukprot:SAG22_NODE_188_length_15821_cov_38.313319_21_plen_84_part_00